MNRSLNRANGTILSGIQERFRDKFALKQIRAGSLADKQSRISQSIFGHYDGDKIEISDQGRDISQRHSDALERLQQKSAALQQVMRQMAEARETARAQAEAWRIKRLVMEIAARIIRGDNVPQRDKDFLLEHSPGMFKLAMSLRDVNNEDPEDHASIAEDFNTPGVLDNAANLMQALTGSASSSSPAQSAGPPTVASVD